MKPHDLIRTANALVALNKAKPTEVNLRRAVSSAYYAMFHCLANDCADLLIGGKAADRSKPAWRHVYRSLEHGFAKERCKHQEMIKKFPKKIEDFANVFVTMQTKRHDADYDPFATFTKSDVLSDIKASEQAMLGFKDAPVKDRRAFCAYVLLKERRS